MNKKIEETDDNDYKTSNPYYKLEFAEMLFLVGSYYKGKKKTEKAIEFFTKYKEESKILGQILNINKGLLNLKYCYEELN